MGENPTNKHQRKLIELFDSGLKYTSEELKLEFGKDWIMTELSKLRKTGYGIVIEYSSEGKTYRKAKEGETPTPLKKVVRRNRVELSTTTPIDFRKISSLPLTAIESTRSVYTELFTGIKEELHEKKLNPMLKRAIFREVTLATGSHYEDKKLREAVAKEFGALFDVLSDARNQKLRYLRSNPLKIEDWYKKKDEEKDGETENI